jgi:hypothetical protein
VRAERRSVDIEFSQGNGDLSEGLDRVGVEEDPPAPARGELPDRAGNAGNVLHGAHFVVDEHDGYQDGVVGEQWCHVSRIDPPVHAGLHHRAIDAEPLEAAGLIEHRGVLDPAHHDARFLPLRSSEPMAVEEREQERAVRLGRPRGENDVSRLDAEQPREPCPLPLQTVSRLPARGVGGGGVGVEPEGDIARFFQGRGLGRRGCGPIEVDHLARAHPCNDGLLSVELTGTYRRLWKKTSLSTFEACGLT